MPPSNQKCPQYLPFREYGGGAPSLPTDALARVKSTTWRDAQERWWGCRRKLVEGVMPAAAERRFHFLFY